MELGSFQHLAGLFEAGLSNAVSELNPERAFIAYRSRSSDVTEFPTPYATHGFAMAGLYTNEDISTEVIRKTCVEGLSQLIVDAISAPGLTDRTSVILSGLRSVLTVPLRHSNGLTLGMIYLDNRIKAGAFKKNHQLLLTDLADLIVAEISQVENCMKARPNVSSTDASLLEVKERALLLAEKGSYTEGLSSVEQWICGRGESEDVGLAYAVKGRILQKMGQMKSALESVAVAVYILGNASNNRTEHYPIVLNNLAGLHVALGNLQRAHGLFTASASYWARLAKLESRHYGGLAATQYNLGKLHEQLEAHKVARDWFEQALVSSQEAFGVEHPKTVKIQESLQACIANSKT
jgi:Tetratricopeptide repeat